MPNFQLSKLVRPNIYSLEPYRCARDDFSEGILLDANENPYGPSLEESSVYQENLNRYPDPNQIKLKQKIVGFRNLEASQADAPIKFPGDNFAIEPANLCLGVGSDECIDSLIRTVCVPGKDRVLICPPTYGMYKISSQINDVGVISVPLEFSTFDVQEDKIIEALKNEGESIKIVFLTTPGNPTGNLISAKRIENLLQWSLDNWNGLVVLDEAYIDFAPIGSSHCVLVNKYPNLAVLQTLSKSFGLAAIRLGVTFASKDLSIILNSLKAPYNISSVTSEIANSALNESSLAIMKWYVEKTLQQKTFLLQEFKTIKQFGKVIGGRDANFILIQVLNEGGQPDSIVAKKLYLKLATEQKVVVRFRGNEPGCTGALRITIGTAEENVELVEKIKHVLSNSW